MAGSLSPAFVKIFYNSVFAPHVQIVGTNTWNPGTDLGDFEAWSGSPVQADTMIEAFITAEAQFFPNTVTFTGYEIYTLADTLGAIPLLVGAKNVSITGDVTPGAGIQQEATQATWSFKSTTGKPSKVVMLDVAVTDFSLITSASLSIDEQSFIDEYTGVGNAWAARVTSRPFFFKQIAYTLNEKLRRNYHLN
jgi:hypothetical protein